MLEHEFTEKIYSIIAKHISDNLSEDIYLRSPLLQYINLKTKSVNADSKSRGAYAPLYVIYSLVEDYINNNYHKEGNYSSEYKGARFTDLKSVVNTLPFGEKIQNHSFNNRLDGEFKSKIDEENSELLDRVNKVQIILRISDLPEQDDKKSKRYWINEELLKVDYKDTTYNIAEVVLNVLKEYIKIKVDLFKSHINYLNNLSKVAKKEPFRAIEFIKEQLAPNSDARTFEIVSYSILKYFYEDVTIFWGYEKDNLNEENLKLYKTGRTNANDGGIDYVMKPLGRFFQVTETLDFKKYFLDIDKVQKFPITFVVKTEIQENELYIQIEGYARKNYGVDSIVSRFMDAVEELINIPKLLNYVDTIIENNKIDLVFQEIVKQSKLEFNFDDEEE